MAPCGQQVAWRHLVAGVDCVQVPGEAAHRAQAVRPPELPSGGRLPSPCHCPLGGHRVDFGLLQVGHELGQEMPRAFQLEAQTAAQREILVQTFDQRAHAGSPGQGCASSRSRVRSTLA